MTINRDDLIFHEMKCKYNYKMTPYPMRLTVERGIMLCDVCRYPLM